MTAALIVSAFVLVAAAVVAVWLRNVLTDALGKSRDASADGLAKQSEEVDRRLQLLAETLDRRLGQLDTKVDRRLEAAQKTTTALHERLGKVDSAAAQMLERAKDLSRLEQALRPPKARGGFGELLLENLLRDRLPRTAYKMQYGFSTGERVDAVVTAGDLLIPIDSKFPLDNYQRLVEAQSDDERQLGEKAFARDVKQHVDAIASKYVRPEEGTSDFAFMYIPVEAVYYELACGATGAILQYAHEQRVFPMSPSTFTAYLQVIAFGLRGMQIEQNAEEVMAYVADLNRDFDRFVEDFELVGKHLTNAQTKFASADKRLDKFAGKLEQASQEIEGDEIDGEDENEQFAIEAA